MKLKMLWRENPPRKKNRMVFTLLFAHQVETPVVAKEPVETSGLMQMLVIWELVSMLNYLTLGIQSPSENGNGTIWNLNTLLRRWLYTPIIIWQGDWIPRVDIGVFLLVYRI